MFDFVRNHSRLFQLLLVLLIFPSFIFFGIQGYSRFTDGANKTVATVDGHAITQADLDTVHRRNVETFRRQVPNGDVTLLDTPQARRQSLDALVRERVLLAAAQDQHLFPGDARIMRVFRSDPQFEGLRNADGTVNRNLLQSQGMTSEGFVEQLRTELGMRQVLGGVSATEFAPKVPLQLATDALLQRRQVQVERFLTKDYLAKVKPTDAQVQAWYDGHKKDFLEPEQAKIEYVVLSLDGLGRQIAVSDADARKFYEQNAGRYTEAEERRASHILIKADKDAPAAERAKAKAKAEDVLRQLRARPDGFAELAKKESQDPGSAAQGGDLGFFGRGAMVKPFEDAVYAMKPGEISPVIESDFGYHVIRMDAARGGKVQPFEAVKDAIVTEIRRSQAQQRYAEAADKFGNMVYEQSESLQPVVDQFKLERQTATVQRTPAPGATGPLASPKLLGAIFGNEVLDNKRNSEAIETAPSELVSARVVQYTPAATPPLERIRERVVQAATQQQARELADKAGQDRLAQLRDGKTAMTVDKIVVSRTDPKDLAPQTLQAVFGADGVKLPQVVGQSLGADGYAVARIDQVMAPADAASAAQRLAPQYAGAWGAAESTAYYEALKRRYKVEIKPDALIQGDAAAAASAAASGG